jgi:hypothetical protein
MPIRGSPNGAPSPPSTGWSRSPGTGGRDQWERLVAINRNPGRDHPVRAGETDCVAGHIGFELPNPSGSYPIVFP